MLSIEDVRLVAAMAVEGNARRAATRLGNHVATLYRQLRALEQRLGVTLFERSDGRYVPTAFASEVVAVADTLQETLDALGRRAAGQDDRLTGTIAVTTTDTLLPLVTRAIASFAAAQPNLKLELSIGNMMADMVRHDADVAIRPTASPPETLIGRQLGEFTFARYAMTADATEWIGFDDSLSAVPSVRWAVERMSVPPRVRCNSLWAAAHAAAAGLGWAVLPDYLARDLPLVRIGEPIAELRSAVWMLYHPDLRRTPRVRQFFREVAPRLSAALKDPSSLR